MNIIYNFERNNIKNLTQKLFCSKIRTKMTDILQICSNVFDILIFLNQLEQLLQYLFDI